MPRDFLVSIAEAILWGEQHCSVGGLLIILAVSIAEAILWGEQHPTLESVISVGYCFNRRGDSLGGATSPAGD